MDGSLEGSVKQGCYKTEFETVNCWTLKVAGKAAPFLICNLLIARSEANNDFHGYVYFFQSGV